LPGDSSAIAPKNPQGQETINQRKPAKTLAFGRWLNNGWLMTILIVSLH
jgi:hypothetical protein